MTNPQLFTDIWNLHITSATRTRLLLTYHNALVSVGVSNDPWIGRAARASIIETPNGVPAWLAINYTYYSLLDCIRIVLVQR